MVDLCAQSTESVSRSEDKFMTKEEYFRLARIGDRVLCCSFLTILTLCFFCLLLCYSETWICHSQHAGYDLGTISREDVSTVMTPENMKGSHHSSSQSCLSDPF